MTDPERMALARRVVAECGPASQASDLGGVRIAFALANAEVLVRGQCQCTEQGKFRQPPEVFFMRPSGVHGWMCVCCRKITQTG